MGTPCIVCQENCPVSPKAIYTTEEYETVRDGIYKIASADGDSITFASGLMKAGAFATGDYYLVVPSVDGVTRKITDNTADSVKVAAGFRTKPAAGQDALVQVRLQKPWVDIRQCIGCGICEHECPVSGQRAIRVSAEGESRNKRSRLGLR
jgi:formate hydrogenlyase subunit 6/NADH:ubiquinone oxidoreductase subunit I